MEINTIYKNNIYHNSIIQCLHLTQQIKIHIINHKFLILILFIFKHDLNKSTLKNENPVKQPILQVSQ